MARAFIGLGANLGDRLRSCTQAVEMLARARGIRLIVSSSPYETEPWGKTDQPNFINSVVAVETTLTPQQLLQACQAIEHEIGRGEGEHWGPRLIDLDILLYNEQVVTEADLKIPHPRLHERRFVLAPLHEIAPSARHPLLCKTASALLSELGDGGGTVRRLGA